MVLRLRNKNWFLNILLLSILVIGLISGVVLAQKNQNFRESANTSQNDKIELIPENAKLIKKGYYDLGEITHQITGEKLQKIMIVDDFEDDSNVKGSTSEVLQSSTSNCVGELLDPATVRTNISSHTVVIDTQNNSGLTQAQITSAMNRIIYQWEGASGFNLVNNVTVSSIPDGAATGGNGTNDITFAYIYDNPNGAYQTPNTAKAITTSYVDSQGNIVESDIVVNEFFLFATNGDPTRYDFETVMLHEFGHVTGLGHVDNDGCQSSIMYVDPNYSYLGVVKRNLSEADDTAAYNIYYEPVAIPNPVPPTIQTSPLSDSYTSVSYPNSNYGNSSVLISDSSPVNTSYLKLDLRNLVGQTISRASLMLWINNSSSNVQSVNQVASSWTETGISYSNRPSVTSTITTFTAQTAGTWKEVDLTNFVNQHRGSLVSISIGSGGSDDLKYNSKNSSSNKPRLDIRFVTTATSPTPTPRPK